MAHCLDFGDPSSPPGVEDDFEPLAPAEEPECSKTVPLPAGPMPSPLPDALRVRRRWQRPTSRTTAAAGGGNPGPYHLGPPLPGTLVYTDPKYEDPPPAAAPPENDEMAAPTDASDEEPLIESSGEEVACELQEQGALQDPYEHFIHHNKNQDPAEAASPTSRKTCGIRRIHSYLSEDTSADERPQEMSKEEAAVRVEAKPALEIRREQDQAAATKNKLKSASFLSDDDSESEVPGSVPSEGGLLKPAPGG
ncbi:unnamed protein product [Symbiodinium sp. CCMP2456]|nr:unnamed protein product [Symbiodinium sp. CCMP2456]